MRYIDKSGAAAASEAQIPWLTNTYVSMVSNRKLDKCTFPVMEVMVRDLSGVEVWWIPRFGSYGVSTRHHARLKGRDSNQIQTEAWFQQLSLLRHVL